MTKIVTNRNKRNKEYSNNETMLLITMIKLMMVIIIIGKKRNRQNTLRTLGNLEIRKWVGRKIRIRRNARIQIVITITITSTPTPTLRIGRVPSSPLVLKTLADDSAPVQLLRDFPRLGAIIFLIYT